MRVRSMVWLTVVALLAVSCSGGADPTTSTTTSTSTTTTTTAPPTTTTTTTTVAPTTTVVVPVTLSPSDPFVTTGGMGPIRIGMTVAEAEEAAGFEFTVLPGDGSCFHIAPPEDETAYTGVIFMVIDDAVVRIEVGPDSATTTRSGAGVGMSETALRAMFPDQLEEAQYSDSLSGLEFVPRDEEDAQFRVVFALLDGEIVEYRSGLLPAVGLQEGCA